ncbi:MAG: hydroxyethylthiazole kinase [Chloroflexota bacterium]
MSINTSMLWADIVQIREKAPLIHNITNFVVMNNTANALLALGGSPIMAHAVEEVADMVKICNALVVNIGTLSSHWITAMEKAIDAAAQANIPIVLDPVGAGATSYRTNTVHSLMSIAAPSIIRGNASEIKACVTEEAKTKGVDSLDSSESAIEAARQLHATYGCTVVISGETDFIVSGGEPIQIKNGHVMMTKVTGLGCTATALCGAFAAVNSQLEMAAAHAMAVMGIAGEMATEQANGPGTLQLHFLDALYNLSAEAIEKRLSAA